MEHLLNVSGVSASVDEKPILHGIDLSLDAGEPRPHGAQRRR